MEVHGRVVVVTGAASGIGKALCKTFLAAGAFNVVAADRDEGALETLRNEISCTPIVCDVSHERDIISLVDATERTIGPIDLFCSNAGVAAGFDNSFVNVAAQADDVWRRAWEINVMAHVYAARVLVPRMTARGGGYFLNTASAAGLLSQIGSAAYATTKHAAIAFAETLAITHRKDGVRVSVLCPQAVDTPMLRGIPSGPQSLDGILSADAVADAALEGILREQFLILPHPSVQKYVQRKVADYDLWLKKMGELQERISLASGG